VQRQFSLVVHENLQGGLAKLAADGADLLGQGSGEHHHLGRAGREGGRKGWVRGKADIVWRKGGREGGRAYLLFVGGGPEDLLNVTAHVQGVQQLVALVEDETLHVVEL